MAEIGTVQVNVEAVISAQFKSALETMRAHAAAAARASQALAEAVDTLAALQTEDTR